jgi:hypothetical protein
LVVTAKRTKATDVHWALWETFCLEHNMDPFVRHSDDPIPIIQVFAQRHRGGWAAPKHNAVRSGTAEDAVRVVGQAFAHLGGADIGKDAFGEIDVCLTQQFWCNKKEGSPPSCVKPVPIPIFMFIIHQASASNSSKDRKAITDLITITFYFLLLPGEYTGTTYDDTPFHLQEVELHANDRLLDTLMATSNDPDAATTVSLMFTTHKK